MTLDYLKLSQPAHQFFTHLVTAMQSHPLYCRPEAYDHFAKQLPIINTTDGLLHAAVAISMHALDDVDPEEIDVHLLALATRVRHRIRGKQVQAVLAHLHHVLFDEQGFFGNQGDYYSVINSYLPFVIESRLGIPVTLSLLYKVVAQRVGLFVQGVNAPGHFLVRVRGINDWIIVDPFFGGTVLNREEAFERIERVSGQELSHTRENLKIATHKEWISRILANVQHNLAKQGRRIDLMAMRELQDLLDNHVTPVDA